MEKRDLKRIPTNLYSRFLFGNLSYPGIVKNLSENGMYIKTSKCLPLNVKLELFIPLIEEVIKIPVEVSRIIGDGDMYNGIGIELLEQPQHYLDLVKSLRFYQINLR
jgi:hypothetical protein